MPNFAKLQSLRQRIPFCSQSALEAILTLAAEEGVPASHKRKQIRQSVEEVIAGLCLYGPLLVTATAMTVEEDPVQLVFANIFSYLAGAYAAGGCFADYLDKVHGHNPSSFNNPWSCILYADELHPGNQLAGSARKTWAIYFSFAQFGPMLSNSDSWFTLLLARSEKVSQLAASIGQCFRLILEHMFDNKHAHPHAGVLLKRGSKRLKLYWTLGFFLQDGSAQKFTYSNKQDAGSRVCMMCKNVFVLTKEDEEVGDKKLAQFTKLSQLDVATDEEILSSWSRMQERASSCNKAEFKKWSQAAGIDFAHQALLLSETLRSQNLLRPISQYMHDYMHGLCSNGVLNWVIFLWIQALASSGMANIWETLQGFLQIWVQPALHKCNLQRLFQAKAVESHKKAGKFKCSASEILGLYKVLAYYAQVCCLPNGICLLESACFLAWCKVLDYCLSIPALAKPDHLQLLAFVEAALGATVTAGWSDEFKPKMHWTLHFSEGLRRHKQLPACWSMERKHKDIRKYGNVLFNTSQWEASLMKPVIAEHIFALGEESDLFTRENCLSNPKNPTKKMMASLCNAGVVSLGMACMHSSCCKLSSGATLASGDVVYLHNVDGGSPGFTAAQVHCFLTVPCGDVALVEKYLPQDMSGEQYVSKWAITTPRNLSLASLEEIICAVTYNAAKGKVTCLTPAFLQF